MADYNIGSMMYILSSFDDLVSMILNSQSIDELKSSVVNSISKKIETMQLQLDYPEPDTNFNTFRSRIKTLQNQLDSYHQTTGG